MNSELFGVSALQYTLSLDDVLCEEFDGVGDFSHSFRALVLRVNRHHVSHLLCFLASGKYSCGWEGAWLYGARAG